MADGQGASIFCRALSLSKACEEVMRIQIVMMRTLGKAFLFFATNTPISFDFLDCFIHVSASACSNGVNFVQKCKKKYNDTFPTFQNHFYWYHTEGNCMRKKQTKNLTNISLNKGAVSILVRALKHRQIFPGTQQSHTDN